MTGDGPEIPEDDRGGGVKRVLRVLARPLVALWPRYPELSGALIGAAAVVGWMELKPAGAAFPIGELGFFVIWVGAHLVVLAIARARHGGQDDDW